MERLGYEPIRTGGRLPDGMLTGRGMSGRPSRVVGLAKQGFHASTAVRGVAVLVS